MATADSSTAASYLVVARHGERLDYVMRDKGENWIPTASRPWDPPLSHSGLEQANQLGRHLFETLPQLSLPPLSGIYSSPLLRCRQTAVAAVQGYNDVASINNNETNLPLVVVEDGLAESINESWYRSWAMPYSNGTWGLRPKGESKVDVTCLKPEAKQPVQNLLDWKDLNDPVEQDIRAFMDLHNTPKTCLTTPFQFAEPKNLESDQAQRLRMRTTVSALARPGETVLLVSHGGPVTHLYEELTQANWEKHGATSYCCYSIYKRTFDETNKGTEVWEALVVNEDDFLDDDQKVYEEHLS